MKLSFKDTQFVIEAIDNLVTTYENKLERQDLDRDEAADLGNDCMFLQSLRHTLSTKSEFTAVESQTRLSGLLQTSSSRELIDAILELSINRRLALIDAITQSIRQKMHSVSRT
jgi:hypothetical protein